MTLVALLREHVRDTGPGRALVDLVMDKADDVGHVVVFVHVVMRRAIVAGRHSWTILRGEREGGVHTYTYMEHNTGA